MQVWFVLLIGCVVVPLLLHLLGINLLASFLLALVGNVIFAFKLRDSGFYASAATVVLAITYAVSVFGFHLK